MRLTLNLGRKQKYKGPVGKIRQQIEHALDQTDLDERLLERAEELRDRAEQVVEQLSNRVPKVELPHIRERVEHLSEEVAARAPHIKPDRFKEISEQMRERAGETVEEVAARAQQIEVPHLKADKLRERVLDVVGTVQASMPGYEPERNIWSYSEALTRWLIGWNLLNVAAGFSLAKDASPARRGIATQNVSWGVINILIGMFGLASTRRRKAKTKRLYAPEVLKKETRNLRTLLLVNLGLDVLYMIGGGRLKDNLNVFQRGVGTGIILQGALLFVWDLILLVAMPNKKSQGIRH